MKELVYQIISGSIAAVVYLVRLDSPTQTITLVYLSKEKGVLGPSDKPIEKLDLPLEVVSEVYRHFEKVFSLSHEYWKGPSKSPRAEYCDKATTIQVVVPQLSEDMRNPALL